MKTYPIFKPASGGGTGLTTDLISVWEFNEVSGTTAFDSHGSNDGTNSNATVNQSGKINTSYLFNGSSSYVNFGNIDTDPISVSMWFRPTTSAANFIGGNYEYGLSERVWYMQSGNTNSILRLRVAISSNGTLVKQYASDDAITVNAWNHGVFTFENNDLKIYLNGVSQIPIVVTENTINSLNVSGQPLILGSLLNSGTPANFYTGYLDQTAIWNKVLTATEVSTLYNSGNGLAYTSW